MASTSCGKRSKRSKTKSKRLKLSDVKCPICLSVVIEPVTMPCNHELCKICFEKTVQNVTLTCPVCRRRISSWTRKAAKKQTLVNQYRWKEIQELFPDHIKKKLTGEESSEEDEVSLGIPKISSPGSIRKEYEIQLQRHETELEKEREMDRIASEKYIAQLKMEEEKLLEAKELLAGQDERLAKELHEGLNQGIIHDETQEVEKFLKKRKKEVLCPPVDYNDLQCHSRNCSMNFQSTVLGDPKSENIPAIVIDDEEIVKPSAFKCCCQGLSDMENFRDNQFKHLNTSTPVPVTKRSKSHVTVPVISPLCVSEIEPFANQLNIKDSYASTSGSNVHKLRTSEIENADYAMALKLQKEFDKELQKPAEKRKYSLRTLTKKVKY